MILDPTGIYLSIEMFQVLGNSNACLFITSDDQHGVSPEKQIPIPRP